MSNTGHLPFSLGTCSTSLARPDLEASLDVLQAAGLTHVQLDLQSAGLETLPEAIDPAVCDRIAAALAARGLTLAAVAGTCNLIHPEHDRRRENLRRLRGLAASCGRLGTGLITLSTGTRDRQDLWRAHTSNTSWAAWEDLVDALEAAVAIAEAHELTVAIEPHPAHVIDSAAEAVRIIDRLGGPQPRLKVVCDPGTWIPPGAGPRRQALLDEALDLLAPHLALARLGAGTDAPALDHDGYLAGLRRIGYHGPLIVHGSGEADLMATVAELRRMAPSGLGHVPSDPGVWLPPAQSRPS